MDTIDIALALLIAMPAIALIGFIIIVIISQLKGE